MNTPQRFLLLSLLRKRIQAPASNVCKVTQNSLFWVFNGLNESPEVRVEFYLHYDLHINNGFLTGQSRRVLKSWSLSGTQNKDCGAGCQKDLTRGLVSSVAQLTCYWNGYAVAVWTIGSLTTLSITISILHLVLSQKSKWPLIDLSKIN